MLKTLLKADFFPLFCTVCVVMLPFLLALVLGIIPLNLSWLILLVTIGLTVLLVISTTMSVRKSMRRHKWVEISYINAGLMVFSYVYLVWSVFSFIRVI